MRTKFEHPFIFAITFLSGLLLYNVAPDPFTYFIVTLILALFASLCLTALNELETEVAFDA